MLKAAFPRHRSELPAIISLVENGETVQIADSEAADERIRKLARARGWRSATYTPLMNQGTFIGFIVCTRRETGMLADHYVQLLRTFADQAVIAIENARLFNETKEALERQAATSNILRVISQSPTDVQPVFEEIVLTAVRLTGCDLAFFLRCDGATYLPTARATPEGLQTDARPSQPIDPDANFPSRAIVEKKTLHLPDWSLVDPPAYERWVRETFGIVSSLYLPLLCAGECIGLLVLAGKRTNIFGDREIALAESFRDQAMIAIENVRLFDEVQAKTHDLEEALRYQTGSSNILSVIASSPTDVRPVLKAIVASACELCDAYDAIVILKDEGELQIYAHHGPIPVNLTRWPYDRSTTSGRAMADRRPVHVHDVLSDEGLEFPMGRTLSLLDGCRTLLGVPLLREGEAIGAIVLRRAEVHPFSDKQIALLQTFADQAVIAIGNARLFEEVQERTNELTESLEQQTATSEVLKVISESSGELEPVFSKMLENATRICGAEFGTMTLYGGGGFRTVALYNAPQAYVDTELYKLIRPRPDSGLAFLEKTHKPVHIEDLRKQPPDIEGDPNVRALVDLAGARTLVIVPMAREGELVGAIGIFRQEVMPFTEKQTDLVANFASQAVIAIENARLLNELRDRTDELTRSLNELRTAQDRLVQTEKLASLGQLTAGIAHEIKNPLNFVNNFSALSAELIDELDETLTPAPLDQKMRSDVGQLTQMLKSNLEKVVQHGKRADSIVKNMLLHSREGSGERRFADINALVGESLNLAYHGARAEKAGFNITLEHDLDPEAGAVDLYPQEITRALLNLISNGFYAATRRKAETGDETFEPVLSAGTRNLGKTVEIRIRDNGTGIASEVREKIFNPFFTTKPTGEGTGLGLSMAHDIIVKQHGGRIDVETVPGAFTEFIITLPRDNGAAVGRKPE